MQTAKSLGPARAWNACGASLHGLRGAARNEAAFGQELLARGDPGPLGRWIGLRRRGWRTAAAAPDWALVLLFQDSP